MSKPKVFISYSHQDEHWKNRLVSHLDIGQQEGLYELWDDRKIEAGEDWYDAIIRAIEAGQLAILLVSRHSLTSRFIRREEAPRLLAQRDLQQTRIFPVIVEPCDWPAVEWLAKLNLRPFNGRPVGETKDKTRTEFQKDLDLAEIAKEIRQLLTVEPATLPTPEPLTGECPYLGLEAFTENKKHLFFGRDDFADALFTKVKRQHFVALIGPSGCGKSSVVQAGLFPRLRRDTQTWVINFFQPQENPFLSLAAEFIRHWQPQASSSAFINQAAKLATELKVAQLLIEAIRRTVAAPDGRLLLVVDQFEELFTLCDESDRCAFLDVLLEVKYEAPLTILLTLRADFMGYAQSFSPTFSQLLDESIVSHRPLTRVDLESTITGPARYAGLEFEPGLVNLILQEVAAQPDSLPLLEYAMKEMWRKRQSQVMGYALYEEVGKVEGAISQHADAVLHALPEAEQALALRALTRLVRVAGEEGEADTRLRLPLSELPEAERDVLQTFVTARLLVTKREEGAGAETIEVAHEALIRRWENLRKALDSDREFLIWRRRLDSRRKSWEQKGRDDKWLLYGGERDDAQRWLNERGEELTAAEIEFITWDGRPEFQIERILSQSPSFLLFSDDEIRKDWFTTLIFCREKEKALSIAREIEDAYFRVHTLSSMAEALSKVEIATEAHEVATEALATARKIEDVYSRARALSLNVKALVRAGMATEAREAAMEALAAAREIKKDTPFRTLLLSSIAGAIVIVKMVPEALAAARGTEDAPFRTQLLSSIVMSLVKVEMATEALAAAREIEDPSYRANALSSTVQALVRAGMVTEALAVARKIEGASDRVYALSSIVQAMVRAGMVTQAREAAIEALAAAREIEGKYYRIQPLSSIVWALVKAGMAAESWAAAREDASFRTQLLFSIVWAMVREEMVTEASAIAREINDAFYRANAMSLIAEALMKAGVAMEAREAATESMAAALKIEDASSRAKILLMVVVDFWLEQKQNDDARNLLEDARDAISKVFDDKERSELTRRLAVILARLHSYRAARETAEQCASSSDRLAAYTAILREYHVERDPGLAQLFVKAPGGKRSVVALIQHYEESRSRKAG